ncbi:MAG: hypothetical protein KDD45_08410 [Bdellovibrionales bacterium]|nr:hypothetical protein [Bdellovibrionales bacterium]
MADTEPLPFETPFSLLAERPDLLFERPVFLLTAFAELLSALPFALFLLDDLLLA